MDAAVRDGTISHRQYIRISDTDLIMRAQRRVDRASVWVAIEASNRVDEDDIRRAKETADILQMVVEGEFLAVAVGLSINERDQVRADAAGVTYMEVAERY
jgi:hypothetical protein